MDDTESDVVKRIENRVRVKNAAKNKEAEDRALLGRTNAEDKKLILQASVNAEKKEVYAWFSHTLQPPYVVAQAKLDGIWIRAEVLENTVVLYTKGGHILPLAEDLRKKLIEEFNSIHPPNSAREMRRVFFCEMTYGDRNKVEGSLAFKKLQSHINTLIKGTAVGNTTLEYWNLFQVKLYICDILDMSTTETVQVFRKWEKKWEQETGEPYNQLRKLKYAKFSGIVRTVPTSDVIDLREFTAEGFLTYLNSSNVKALEDDEEGLIFKAADVVARVWTEKTVGNTTLKVKPFRDAYVVVENSKLQEKTGSYIITVREEPYDAERKTLPVSRDEGMKVSVGDHARVRIIAWYKDKLGAPITLEDARHVVWQGKRSQHIAEQQEKDKQAWIKQFDMHANGSSWKRAGDDAYSSQSAKKPRF